MRTCLEGSRVAEELTTYVHKTIAATQEGYEEEEKGTSSVEEKGGRRGQRPKMKGPELQTSPRSPDEMMFHYMVITYFIWAAVLFDLSVTCDLFKVLLSS